MEKKLRFIVVEMGDDTNLPVTQGSTNYYLASQEVYADGEIGQTKLLAFVGCQGGARTFVYELADRATKTGMAKPTAQAECWAYIQKVHEANKTPKQSKRPSPEKHAAVDIDEPEARQRVASKNASSAPKHDLAADVNTAIESSL